MSKYQLKANTIYCGDCIKMLKDIPDNSVDLTYVDPPFNSNRNYETFWGDIQEKRAFEDRFGDAQAYIEYMRPRIVEIYRVLKPTGSFYYHCDWDASHYIKIMLDQIFNFNNFVNEIIWCYTSGGKSKKHFARKHHTIFFYSKSNKYTFNDDAIRIPYSKKTLANYKEGLKGSSYTSDVKLNEAGKVPEDYWDIAIASKSTIEYKGYPTQKPLELLDRIVKASSNKGDIVLDAFCGCGTTLVSAQKTGRKWIGIDISPTACRVMADRLWDIFKIKEGKDFFVESLPTTEKELRELPHFEFQNWAVIALGGIPNKIKTGDYGIDGKLYPIALEKKKAEKNDLFGENDIYYPIQVKQKDKAGRPDIDSFETAIRRDGRKKGYFISFDFTSDAIQEIKRLDKAGEIEIIPITVKELLRKEQYNL